MWYGEICVHLYDLLDVLAAKATATTEATATAAAAKKNKRAQSYHIKDPSQKYIQNIHLGKRSAF